MDIRLKVLAKNVRALRLIRGLTIEQLAMRAETASQTISLIERGVSVDPRISTVLAIAQALDVTIDELLDDQ